MPYTTTVHVQTLTPGTYVWCEASDEYERVLEYPVVTSTHVYVNVTGGNQLAEHYDTAVEVMCDIDGYEATPANL